MRDMKSQMPVALVAFLFVIAIVNGLAEINHWYWEMRWFDIPMHFAGGVWLAGVGVWWQYFRVGRTFKNFLSLLAVCLIFAFSIGFLWEAFEAVVSFATVGHMNDIFDTRDDILFDILGGVVVAILVWVQSKQK